MFVFSRQIAGHFPTLIRVSCLGLKYHIFKIWLKFFSTKKGLIERETLKFNENQFLNRILASFVIKIIRPNRDLNIFIFIISVCRNGIFHILSVTLELVFKFLAHPVLKFINSAKQNTRFVFLLINCMSNGDDGFY